MSFVLKEIISYTFCLVPILFMLGTELWKNLKWDEKAVTAMLAVFSISNCVNIHIRVQSFLVFALFAVIYGIKNRHFRIPDIWLYCLFFLYFLWHAISLIWTPDFTIGVSNGVSLYVLFLLIPLSFCLVDFKKGAREMLYIAIFRSLFVFAAITMATMIYQSIKLSIPFTDWFHIQKCLFNGQNSYTLIFSWLNYDSPTYLSVILIIGMTIGIYQQKLHRAEVAIYTILALAVIVASQSRIGVLNFVIACSVIVLFKIGKNKIAISSIIAAAILAIVLLCIFKQEKMKGFFYDPIRVQNFRTAEYYIKQKPVLGCGVAAMNDLMDSDETAIKLGYECAHKDLRNPHYQFVGDFMQTGIIGLIICLTMYGCIAVYAIKKRNKIMLLFFLNFFTLSFTEMPLNSHWGTLLLLSYIGLFTIPEREEEAICES